jgi:hypothetical protein
MRHLFTTVLLASAGAASVLFEIQAHGTPPLGILMQLLQM